MQFDTFLFGKIEVANDAIVHFPGAIAGFPQCKRFTLIHEQSVGEDPASFTLQSLDDPAIAFQIADPTTFGFDYELVLTPEESALLKAESPGDIAVMLVLFRREQQGAPIEANLRAPLLINTQTRVGIQKVIDKLRPNLTLSNLATTVGD